MGAYLTKPVTDKVSDNYKSEKFTCGSSSMQGWRSSQEDAHNCILELDKDISLFAVYDGHGGAEVAKYCSMYFPAFFKKNASYKEGNFEKALIESFIEFDNLIKDPQVINELKSIARVDDREEESNESATGKLVKLYQNALSARLEAENVSEEETAALCQEAAMPLKDILAKYQTLPALDPKASHLKEEKPMSPMLHAKKNSPNKSELVNGSDEVAENCFNGKIEENEVVSNSIGGSSEVVLDKPKKCEAESSEISSNSSDPNDCEPSSSSIDPPGNEASSSSQVSASSRPRESLDSGGNGAGAKESNEASYHKSEEASSLRDEPSSSSGSSANNLSEPSSSNNKEEPTSNSLSSEPCSSNQEKRSSSHGRWGADLDSESSEEDEDKEYSHSDDSDSDSAENESDEDEEEDESDDEDDDGFCLMSQLKGNTMPGYDSGCTAVVAVVRDKTLFVANAGDSRCVVCRNGEAVEMSFDHKPDDEPEKQRIQTAGGTVTSDGRVNGGLNLSRAIGDHSYKQNEDLSPREQMITALPDIKTLELDSEKDQFIVLACDGIWNYMASQDVVDFVKSRISKHKSNLSDICEELFKHCLAPSSEGDGTGCDNMTCIIVQFTNNNKNNKRPAEEDVEPSSPLEPVSQDAKRIKLQHN